MKTNEHEIVNYIDGDWKKQESGRTLSVINAADQKEIGTVHLSGKEDVKSDVETAEEAYREGRRTAGTKRIQYLFHFKNLLEEHIDELAKVITNESGKTYKESVGEIRRGIENVENACGMPTMMQGFNNEDIATGIDEHMILQSLGIVVEITIFYFTVLFTLWYLT